MTMHLEGPWLTKIGKRKGKQKFRNAAEAQRARELAENWQDLKKRWGVEQEEKKRKRAMNAPVWTDSSLKYRDQDQPKPKSLNTWITGAVTSKPAQQYTGEKVLGITIVHKSCLQPVFTQQEAIDAAKMRR